MSYSDAVLTGILFILLNRIGPTAAVYNFYVLLHWRILNLNIYFPRNEVGGPRLRRVLGYLTDSWLYYLIPRTFCHKYVTLCSIRALYMIQIFWGQFEFSFT